MKKNFIATFLILFFLFTTNLKSDDQIDKLKILLEKGLITESEFKKAVELTGSRVSKIDIRKISGKSGREKFEKYEFYIDNYRVHTLGPGTVRIDNILTGETDVTLTGNFISKITKDGKKNFKFEFNEEELKSNLLYKGQVLINWTARYVRRYQATFHQMQVLGYQPFHYFIMLPGKNPIALNFNLFNKKIDKAVAKVKQELSIKYNLSISDIDKIMEKKENVVSKEQEKIIKELTEKYAGKEITDAIRQEIEKTIGEEMANALISEIEQATGQAIDDAVEKELAAAINEAVSYAIQQGVSKAAAEAAIAAMIWVYANGGSDEDAMRACRQYAGDAC